MKYNKNPVFLNIFKAFVIQPVIKILYRFKIEGNENLPDRGPAALVCKHQSWIDLFAVSLVTKKPMNYAAKKELFENLFCDFPGTLLCYAGAAVRAVVAKSLEWLGAFPLDRDHPAKFLSSFRHVQELMKSDEFLVLFPEGRVIRDRMGEFKPGFINLLLKMQKRSGIPIKFVPVGISYSKKDKFRKEIIVKIGNPVLLDCENKDAAEIIKKKVEEMTIFF